MLGPGNWASQEILHWCRGCCESRDAAVIYVFTCICDVLMHSGTLPALNKWLSVLPCVQELCLLANFHDILRRALLLANGAKQVLVEEPLNDQDAELDVPKNEKRVWQYKERKRSKRSVEFFNRPHTRALLIAYIYLVKPVIRVHLSLFKSAKERPVPGFVCIDDSEGDSETERRNGFGIFKLCDLKRSSLVKCFVNLGLLLFSTAWSMVDHVLQGAPDAWPVEFWMSIRGALCKLIGNASRRLLKAFATWPWKCAEFCDPSIPYEQRLVAAKRFFDVEECCLDKGFSLQLRKKVKDHLELMSDKIQGFVRHMLMRTLVTTVQIEMQFASFKQWLLRSLKPLSIMSLSAKHCVNELHKTHKDFLKMDAKGSGQTSKRKKRKITRPLWASTKQKAKRCNGTHMYMSQALKHGMTFTQAKQSFGVVPPADLNAFSKKAVKKNGRDKALKQIEILDAFDDLRNREGNIGPWKLGNHDLAYSEDRLRADGYGSTGFVSEKATAWECTGKTVYRAHEISDAPLKPWRQCGLDWSCCKKTISPERSDMIAEFCRGLEAIMLSSKKQEVMAIGHHVVQCISWLQQPFTADFMLYETPADFHGVGPDFEWPVHVAAQQEDFHGVSIVKVKTESELAECLFTPELREQPDVHICSWTRDGPQMSNILLTGSIKADITSLRNKLDEGKKVLSQVKAALAALNKACGQKRKTSEQPKSNRGKGPPAKRVRSNLSCPPKRCMAHHPEMLQEPIPIMDTPALECEEDDQEEFGAEAVAAWQDLAEANNQRTRGIAQACARADRVEEPAKEAALPEVPKMIKGGYIVDCGGTLIGRVYSPPQFIPNPSVHVSCSCKDPLHTGCSIWINSSKVPDMNNLRRWIAAGYNYASSEAHLQDSLCLLFVLFSPCDACS